MNVNKISSLLPADFEYEYIDESGETAKEEIKIRIKRLSFRKITAEKFKEAMAKTAEHPEEIAVILAECIDWWDLYTDDNDPEGSMLAITADTIADREANLVLGLSQAVFEKLFPNPPTAERSQDGSAQAEKSIAVQS